MKTLCSSLFIFLAAILRVVIPVNGQPLQSVDYRYTIDPTNPFQLNLRPVRTDSLWKIYVRLSPREVPVNEYTLTFELRNDLQQSAGETVNAIVSTPDALHNKLNCEIHLPVTSQLTYFVVRITHQASKTAWINFTSLNPQYPSDNLLLGQGQLIIDPYTTPGEFQLFQPTSVLVSRYSSAFPSAAPVFAESLGAVAQSIAPDSLIQLQSERPVSLKREGLYLFQSDTSKIRGVAILVREHYPKLTTIEDLIGPMIYLCTPEEYAQLTRNPTDKKTFDRVVLGIIGDKERAKRFMRNYFNRVEQSNQFFTSYKDGWKTDRGMLYIVFGPPENLYKLRDREIWTYTIEGKKVNFEFIRSSTLFDPDNLVLLRKSEYMLYWYSIVDLWRNAAY